MESKIESLRRKNQLTAHYCLLELEISRGINTNEEDVECFLKYAKMLVEEKE